MKVQDGVVEGWSDDAERHGAELAPAGYDARIADLPEYVRKTIDDIIDN